MSLYRGLRSKLFDTRMIEWNLRHGKITKEEYEQHMANLPDETNKSELIKVFSASSETTEEAPSPQANGMDPTILQ